MSQQPIPHPVYTPSPPPLPNNGMGVAGFICSLVGLISCGILSPVGVLFSFIGIFNRPRGLAIAGLILGVLGCCGWLIGWLLGIVGALAVLVGLAGTGAAPEG